MLASALLLLYRAVSVFDGGLSKTSMLAIGFCLGYGAPLIIATITIAVTAPQEAYIQETGVCWLNWQASKALLAFVIPALLIVAINFVILLVVIYKMLRRRVGGDAAQAGERHVLVVIARSLAVLTPFFGLTWSLGVGLMVDPFNTAIHYSFAFFNSLQGFFILVFGTLLDKKVRMSQFSKFYSIVVVSNEKGCMCFPRGAHREIDSVSAVTLNRFLYFAQAVIRYTGRFHFISIKANTYNGV
uniref:G-protein coupled receptors family 2 profile 2 domain-containing protein n=1 Tax=Stegastes partitus TaxID=144197 RepID=A0A3B5A2V8_9TELE